MTYFEGHRTFISHLYAEIFEQKAENWGQLLPLPQRRTTRTKQTAVAPDFESQKSFFIFYS